MQALKRKMSYKIRLFKTKGSILILIWTLFAFMVLTSSTFVNLKNLPYYGIAAVFFPIAGCLSDSYIGRYKSIRYSLRIMWLFLILYNLLLMLEMYVWKSPILAKVKIAASVFTLVGLAGLLANTIHFGIDQLIDASSSDITSYISWYTWILNLAVLIAGFSQTCFCGWYNSVTAFLLLPLLGTIAILSDIFFSKWLVKEPVVQNPFKLLYQVLKYAVKNKYPRQRSAFTYWEDKPYSRIDLGMAKYGGPFTTEQVEDVKTFIRLMAILIATTPLTGLLYGICNLHHYFHTISYMDSEHSVSCGGAQVEDRLYKCYLKSIIQFMQSLMIVLFFPVIELILYPLFMKCSCSARINFMHKILLGVVLTLTYEAIVLMLEIADAYHIPLGHNATCQLYLKYEELSSESKLQIDYKWLLLPQPILAIAIYLLFSSAMEFICAQAPYSMRGLLIGALYIYYGISISLFIGLFKLLQKPIMNVGDKCHLWFHGSLVGIAAILILVQVTVMKLYSFRKRDDTLSNDQMFAVNYFSKYLPRRDQ